MEVLVKSVSKKCIKLSTSGNNSELTYYNDPLELLTTPNATLDDVKKKYTFVELDIYKFSLMLYVKKNIQNQQINKLATRLVGDQKIYGDVIVASMSGEFMFDNLDEVLFNKIAIPKNEIVVATKCFTLTFSSGKNALEINKIIGHV